MNTVTEYREKLTRLAYEKLSQKTAKGSTFVGKVEFWIEDGLVTNFRCVEAFGASQPNVDSELEKLYS